MLYDSGVRKAIDDYLLEESKKVRNYNGFFSGSRAGYCQRLIMFEMLGVPPVLEDARKQRIFSAGHTFHNWIQEITRKANLSLAQEWRLEDDSINVRGHFDDLIKIDKETILYDYKTKNSGWFTRYKHQEISHFYKMQLATYIYIINRILAGKDGARIYKPVGDEYVLANEDLKEIMKGRELHEGRALGISKDDLRTAEHGFVYNPALEKQVFEYWSTLNGYWKAKTMPRCTCADYEGGFMANEKWNPYYFGGEPCSLKYLNRWNKEKQSER